MTLNYLRAQILIAINQGNGDTVSALAKSVATDEVSVEEDLGLLEQEGFVSRIPDALNDPERVELTAKGS